MIASLDAKLASHLKTIRQSRALSLDALAHLSGISRATLSRIENGDTSPTAAHLGKLAAAHSVPVSHLLAQVESAPAPMVRANDQKEWTDPETGFVRRGVSPPAENLTGEVIEGHLPAGQTISYHAPTICCKRVVFRSQSTRWYTCWRRATPFATASLVHPSFKLGQTWPPVTS